jgi:outer membrane lipoprotein
MTRFLLVVLPGVLLASCATVPAPLQGQFTPTTPREAIAGASGQAVRWGSEIIKVDPKAGSTCFEILSRDLDSRARPLPRDPSGGRFIACHEGFQDPEVFKQGREITVVGRVTGIDHGRIGEFDYRYPHVEADAIHLWKPRSQYPHSPYYDPWGYGFGPGWGWGYNPYWGPYWGGTVIIHHDTPRPQPRPRPPPQSRRR